MFKLTFLTPEKKIVVEQELEMIIVPAAYGEMQILKGHSPLITTLSTGILRWKLKADDQIKSLVISWGYCEVTPEGVTILADIADQTSDIDVAKCNENIKKAEHVLATEFLDDARWDSVQRDLARARADLDLVHQKHLS